MAPMPPRRIRSDNAALSPITSRSASIEKKQSLDPRSCSSSGEASVSMASEQTLELDEQEASDPATG
jgi:hypothetical protein